MSLPLIVAQYGITGHPTRTEHWSIAILSSKMNARIFELAGNYDTFVYAPKTVTRFTQSQSMMGGCHIANIPASRVNWLEERLKSVPVIRNDPNFDCQTWVIEALRLMKYDGVISQNISEVAIRTEMAKEKERWDVADDTVEVRLFP
ncbi:hypothetical protein SERLADRAFT_377101 [Serpula lacrymans var. lacrymans S7.9]|uniref:Uncharacterized protein n=1 Tax=Serpula lacrymans var. lacrymans (strain S7.9) TaxID=578457 RepID=F8NFJ0_SERL9|nr:uncharacterized protein SERLADRAFT_377101 [Serpula lacrymans var. lacrymans S7.9]EGO31234.1 hypothetical protein SERLADRAFT_377101 [Serpula lacrymans var. lacrymans S7.9]